MILQIMSTELFDHIIAVERQAHERLQHLAKDISAAAASLKDGRTNALIEGIPTLVGGTKAFWVLQTELDAQGITARLLPSVAQSLILVFTKK